MEPETVTEASDRRGLQRISSLLTLIVVAMGLAFCFLASSLCVTLILSTLLAIVVDPLVVAMEKAGLGRTLAAAFSILCVVILLGVLTYALYQRANAFADQLPTYSYRIEKVLRPLTEKIERLQTSAETLNPSDTSKEVPEVRVKQVPSWPSFIFRGVGSITDFLAIAGIAPFLAFFMLIRKKQMYVRFSNMFEGRIDAARFVGSVKRMVRGYVVGNLIVGAILSGATAAVFLMVGLKSASALGIACGFLNLVPFIGGVLATAVSLAAALLQFDSAGPLIAIGLAIPLLHLVAVNLLIPRLIGTRLLIGPVAMTVGALFWGWLWGVTGLLVAVPLTAFIKLAADSHPRLVHLSNLLAHDPQPLPNWILAGGRTVRRVRPYFKVRRRPRPDRGP